MSNDTGLYAEVILPLAIPLTYSYGVPIEYHESIQVGLRVEVPLKNKLYSGIVFCLSKEKPVTKVRNIISLIDAQPIVTQLQLDLWTWLSEYYCCSIGEVMNVALPSGLKLSSETRLLINQELDYLDLDLTNDEYLIAEALSIQNELTINEVQDILNKKTVYPIIKSLLQKSCVRIKEELTHKFKAKKATYIKSTDQFKNSIEEALALTTRSEKQSRALLSYYSLNRKQSHVLRKDVGDMAGVDSSVFKALEKKGIIEVYERVISRIDLDGELTEQSIQPLSVDQEKALQNIGVAFNNNKVALLHGVTGSGKTRIFVELIKKVLNNGGQVLYLLPEIALTTQIVQRLKSQIGDQLYVYHSQINDPKRVEIWSAALLKNKLFIGARSSLFLPFYNLQLIIVDEEHDNSYKQDSPNPRYQGRDVAVKLATLFKANIILGTATPSLESYHNASIEKYRYIPLLNRFGDSELPDIDIVNLKEAYKKGLVNKGFSESLLNSIKDNVAQGKQVILFQNRRGYAPVVKCKTCGWTAECSNCDVSLTYHQKFNELKCHYCGYRTYKKESCPACGMHELDLLGTGTEKIEDVLLDLIPHISVNRFDHDTTRSKKNQHQILEDFKYGKIDVLIGTQMITKGFDFENIGLVGVLNADSLFSFPDFRSSERSFNLLMQVSGRAGRRADRGKVIIQAFQVDHPVLSEILSSNYEKYFKRELAERKNFIYPPYYHLITVWFKHKDFQKTKGAAQFFYEALYPKLGNRLSKPVDPVVIRVQNRYQQIINVKFEKANSVSVRIKSLLLKTKSLLKSHTEYKGVSVILDVDPF